MSAVETSMSNTLNTLMYFWYLEDRLFHVPDDSVLTPDTDIGIFLAQFTYVLTKITESYGRTVLLPRLTRMLE